MRERAKASEGQLKALYFAYLAAGGLSLTYWPLHFAAVGLSASAIGVVFGVRTASTILFQPWLTAAADRGGRPLRSTAIAFSIGFAMACLQPFGRGFWQVAVPVWIAAPALATIVPLLDASIVRTHGMGAYGRFRLWGSAGFGVMVAGFGLAVRGFDHETTGNLSVWLYLVLTAAGSVLAWSVARDEVATPRPGAKVFDWPGRGFGGLLVASGLHWSAVMIFNVFVALHTAELGLATWVPGVCVGVAIVGEIIAFFFSSRISTGHPQRLLLLVCVAGVFRWVVTGWGAHPLPIVAIQLVHVLSFGVWFTTTMVLLGRFGGPEKRGMLQGLFSALCFGVGGTASSLVGGAAFDLWGGHGAFGLAAGLEVAAAAAYAYVLPRIPSTPPEPAAVYVTATSQLPRISDASR